MHTWSRWCRCPEPSAMSGTRLHQNRELCVAWAPLSVGCLAPSPTSRPGSSQSWVLPSMWGGGTSWAGGTRHSHQAPPSPQGFLGARAHSKPPPPNHGHPYPHTVLCGPCASLWGERVTVLLLHSRPFWYVFCAKHWTHLLYSSHNLVGTNGHLPPVTDKETEAQGGEGIPPEPVFEPLRPCPCPFQPRKEESGQVSRSLPAAPAWRQDGPSSVRVPPHLHPEQSGGAGKGQGRSKKQSQ